MMLELRRPNTKNGERTLTSLCDMNCSDTIPARDWDLCEIRYATSEDGFTWREQGVAVPLGPDVEAAGGGEQPSRVHLEPVLDEGGGAQLRPARLDIAQ